MRISKVRIQNYRNIKDIDIELNRLVILIGDNNSGKSNILRAITLPFFNDEVGNINKRLGWHDINNAAKSKYFDFIQSNLEQIQQGKITLENFVKVIPSVEVETFFNPNGPDEYYIKNWINSIESKTPSYSIKYVFSIKDPKELLKHITTVLNLNNFKSIDNIKMNLLPIEMYKHAIRIPSNNEQVAFNDLANFRYNALAAERDDFSNKNTQLGSKALVNLLHNKLSEEQKVEVEKSYEEFFNELKRISNLDGVFNWQEISDIENAKDFFSEITLLPNMPSMNSLLNNVRIGFGEEYLNTQGLGYRNLIYLLVMINSLEVSSDVALNILTLEEPEAHLCINNEHLLSSFINSILQSNNRLQIFISTHSSEFLNKLALDNVTVVVGGKAFSLKSVLGQAQIDYLAKKPNMDFIKFLFSRKCVLVEGPSEELLIRSYLSIQTNLLSDIEVISLHKGFTKMLEIWLSVNKNSANRIGIIRDYDNQPKAKSLHETYNRFDNILVTTTTEYTLEPEFVQTGNNFEKLKKYFIIHHGWTEDETSSEFHLSEKWKNAKADTMLKFCRDFGKDELSDIELPTHISKVITFLKSGEKL